MSNPLPNELMGRQILGVFHHGKKIVIETKRVAKWDSPPMFILNPKRGGMVVFDSQNFPISSEAEREARRIAQLHV